MKIDADEVTAVTPRDVSLRDIQGGEPEKDAPTARQYLDRLWGKEDA